MLNLRSKSSEQLFNMISNKSAWGEEQLKTILKEIENRGLSNAEVDELKSDLFGGELEVDDSKLQSEFERDLEIISEAEIKEFENEKYQILALVLGLIITLSFAFTLFGGFSLFGIMNELIDAYIYVFINYIILIILWFFTILGFFIGKKYLVSILVGGGLVLFLLTMSFVNY